MRRNASDPQNTISIIFFECGEYKIESSPQCNELKCVDPRLTLNGTRRQAEQSERRVTREVI